MEQRAQLLKRLSFIIFCGEFDQYHQYLPDIQERLAESIRHLQVCFSLNIFSFYEKRESKPSISTNSS